MTDKLYPDVSDSAEGLDTAATMAKNSVAMFVVVLLTKGAGLVAALLVGRYLGPSALGTYAVVLAFALLLEAIAPLGQRYVIVRDVARDRSRLLTYWLSASLVTVVSSVAAGLALVLFIRLARYDSRIFASAYVVSLFLPVAGLYSIAQAVLQGVEQMEFLALADFVGRVSGSLALWVLLEAGAGVEAAFVTRGLFQSAAFVVLTWAILRRGGQHVATRDWRPNVASCRRMLLTSFPFAIQGLLNKAFTQLNTVILPIFISIGLVGIFDAANRIQRTGNTVVPAVTMAVLPALSRTFVTNRQQSVALVEKALKLLLVIVFPFVLIVTIAADQILPVLYGSGYGAAVPVLRIVIWAQVFFVADAVMNQIMMASNNERPMVRRAALSLAANVILTALLAPRYGALGAAWAVVLTAVLNLALDAQFVTMKVCRLSLASSVAKPFLCALLAGSTGFLLRGHGFYAVLILTAGSYLALLLILKVFSPEEFVVLRQLSVRLWQKMAMGEWL
jgi:O-antigen/teichoic acid export membrane protein